MLRNPIADDETTFFERMSRSLFGCCCRFISKKYRVWTTDERTYLGTVYVRYFLPTSVDAILMGQHVRGQRAHILPAVRTHYTRRGRLSSPLPPGHSFHLFRTTSPNTNVHTHTCIHIYV